MFLIDHFKALILINFGISLFIISIGTVLGEEGLLKVIKCLIVYWVLMLLFLLVYCTAVLVVLVEFL